MMLRLQEAASSAIPEPSVDDYASDTSTASVGVADSNGTNDARGLDHRDRPACLLTCHSWGNQR